MMDDGDALAVRANKPLPETSITTQRYTKIDSTGLVDPYKYQKPLHKNVTYKAINETQKQEKFECRLCRELKFVETR
jgi:hypothetical protein